jgi:AraC family transcriptional regulator of adaptative response/methylated-DNA-[protein]-cysteine methyltransferase
MVHLYAADDPNTIPVTTALEDDARWLAMTVRDTSETGPFVIAVSTTGIYCRVGCPARQPLRKNVLFFDSVEEARSAGFRACKRCHPDDQPDLHAT